MGKENPLARWNLPETPQRWSARGLGEKRTSFVAKDSCKIFTITGWSGCGKTTFLERLVAELAARGMRVGVIKHHGHATPTDVLGSDSARFASAGAGCVVVSSQIEYSVRRFPERERTLEELAAEIADGCDIVLAEGFKTQPIRAIELCRAAHSEEPVVDMSMLYAMITDSSTRADEAKAAGVPVFDLADVASVADLMCSELSWEG